MAGELSIVYREEQVGWEVMFVILERSPGEGDEVDRGEVSTLQDVSG
jgi:hypothetical protein